jgi:predicted Zn-dependent protease
MNARAAYGVRRAASALLVLGVIASPLRAQSIGERLRRAAQSAAAVGRTLLPISTEKETEIGRGIAATIAGRYPVSTDTALNRYVNLVGLAVAGEYPRADVAYRFAVLETPDINAFSAPGGYIFLTRGALNLMESEAELAGVLGHEVAHVNRRHVIEAIRKSDTMAAVRDQVNVSGRVLDQVVGTGANVLFTGLSRGDELEADSLGMEYAASVGYDASGLASFVTRLGTHAGEGPAAELFATHPRPADRLIALSRVASREHLAGGVAMPERFKKFVKASP